jgi:glutamate racemase
MKGQRYLGVIDWGIGGVGLYKLVKSELGSVPVIYLSDTGVTPYGKMSRPELVSRLNKVIAFLQVKGISHLALACNAASTAIPFLRETDLRLQGVIEGAVAATARMRPARLALIGGRRTVLSGIYRRAFSDRGISVTQRIAQPLSALIESGDVASSELRDQCRRILSPIRNCSHLLLACTHYPAITPVLRQFVPKETVIVDPAQELVNKIKRWKLPRGGTDIFLTTGDPGKMKRAALTAFNVEIKGIRSVTI